MVRGPRRRAALAAALALVALSCGMAGGDGAVAKMDMREKAFLEQGIMKITPDMSEEQVSEILGPALRGAGTPRPVWKGPGKNPFSQVAVYYINGKIFKIRWMKLGSFVWEKNFRESIMTE